VPSRLPSGAASRWPTIAEIPKSTTLAPAPVSITFTGVMSRCTTPWACAVASAEATSTDMVTASRQGIGPCRAIRAETDSPSFSSITTYGTVSRLSSGDSPKSKMPVMCGWQSRAAASASCRSRSRNAWSPASCGESTLTATDRPSVSS